MRPDNGHQGDLQTLEVPQRTRLHSRRAALWGIGATAVTLMSGCDYRIVIESKGKTSPTPTLQPVRPTLIPAETPTIAIPTPTTRIIPTQVAPSFTPRPTERPTEVPKPTLSPTPRPTEKPTATPVPPSPTPDISPGKILYEANWSNGPDGWVGGPDWFFDRGIFRNNGRGRVEYPMKAPYSIPTNNYAVEATIEHIAKGPLPPYYASGVVARADSSGDPHGYFGGYWQRENQALIGKWGGSYAIEKLAVKSYIPGGDTNYRIEVVGNEIKLLINNRLALQTRDNTYPSGKEAGFWAMNDQVNVKSFKITAL